MVHITFQVNAPQLDQTATIFITGNHRTLGQWDPAQIKMNRQADHQWAITIPVEKNYAMEYKFTRGSWQTEALEESRHVPSNYFLQASGDTTILFTIQHWKDEIHDSPSGQITGEVRYHRDFTGQGLKPRDLIVWLPPDYDKEKKKRYPVFYMHDGRNLFDPSTSFAGIDWQMDEIADSLIRAKKIQPLIIVGIDNTSDRKREYEPGPRCDAYMDYVINKVKPFIDQNYRTKPDAANTAIGGSSAGGLVSFMLAWQHPDVFSKAACLSPAFKIDGIDYVTPVRNDSRKKKKNVFYIDNGGVGLESKLLPGVRDMVHALKEKGFKENKNIFVFYDSKAKHNEAAWSRRIATPLKLFFGK